MDALQLIRKPIEAEMGTYKEMFASCLVHPNALLNEVLKQIGMRSGKMMRPMLTILSSKLFGEAGEQTLNAAVALEFFHTASLVHDDVVDDSDKRRGMPSVNSAYGNKVAVLVGDYILATALQCMCRTSNVRVVSIVSEASQQLASGELLQLKSVHNQEISENVYFDIIKGKTAALFKACTEAGAVVAGASENDVERMKKYGEMVGICFQIRDDIFDYMLSDEIGKPTGNDMKEGKLTLPVIHALYKVNSDEMFAIARKVKDGVVSPEEVERLVQFTKDNGGIDYAIEVMNNYAADAKNLLSDYPDSPVKSALLAYVDYVVGRTF
jgi:octaprenyl-diphosphate synthase